MSKILVTSSAAWYVNCRRIDVNCSLRDLNNSSREGTGMLNCIENKNKTIYLRMFVHWVSKATLSGEYRKKIDVDDLADSKWLFLLQARSHFLSRLDNDR